MALLLDDHLKDYVPGIYHYRRYLDLRGTAEKRAMIEERIRRAEQMFAAGILMPSKRADRVTALERENRLLRVKLGAAARRLEKLEEEVARNRQAAAPQPVSTPRPVVDRVAEGPRTYTVQKGDFLTKISEKVYGDPNRWREIRDANRDKLGSRTDVRPGQVLVIP